MRRGLRLGLELTGLALVLAFVASVAYLPHADSFRQPPDESAPQIVRLGLVYWNWLVEGETDDYEYTVHVDENMHWARMGNMERAESLRFSGAFGGLPEDNTPLHLRGIVHERGFYVAQVHLHQLTGLEWLDIFRFLPAIWAGVTAALVYVALRPWPGAWIAAALVALIPTSPRFLGPGFLVPIGFGMAWIAAAYVVGPTAAKRARGFPLLLLLVVWAFFIHLIAGFAALGVVLALVPFQRRNLRALLALIVTALLPIVALLTAFNEGVTTEIERIGRHPLDLEIFDQMGIPFLFAWGLGCALVALRPPERARTLVSAVTIASVVALGFIVFAIVSRSGAYAIYDRWHQPFVIFAIIPLAYGITLVASAAGDALRDLADRASGARPSFARWAKWSPAPLAALFALLVASPGLAHHISEPYYQVLDDDDWRALLWVRENVNGTYDVFLQDPWKAPILYAETGIAPHSYLIPGGPPINGIDYALYVSGRSNGTQLVEREISLIVDPRAPPSGFAETHDDVAQLEWRYARPLAQFRNANHTS